ncbi:MAG: DUF1015 domain-containing protein [Candidatus Dormibacteria bacterium]
MADVRPFRGVTFDPARVELSAALCPPYDVISPVQQSAYYERDPHNVVRIILNRAEGPARYAEAALALRSWTEEGTLLRDPEPAFYVHRQGFQMQSAAGERRVSRLGLLAAVRLEPWSSGAVLPHEHTMPGPKQDRLDLMRATGADTEPIWVFHPDPGRRLLRLLEFIAATPPTLTAQFSPVAAVAAEVVSETHELWRVTEPDTVRSIAAAASAVQLYIADGHHRYETALVHAEEMGGGLDDASRFKLMLLSAAEDPGLLVLPTHRLLRLRAPYNLGRFLGELRTWGWLTEQPATLADLESRLAGPAAPGALGVGLVAEGRLSYLEGAVPPEHLAELAPSIRDLDVGLLHQGVLAPLLGFGAQQLAEGRDIAYSRDTAEVVELVRRGEYDAGILTRAPSLAQVQAVADAGENMPQKSTYFWPKPASGLVMMPQGAREHL